jgi:hypothetical protein
MDKWFVWDFSELNPLPSYLVAHCEFCCHWLFDFNFTCVVPECFPLDFLGSNNDLGLEVVLNLIVLPGQLLRLLHVVFVKRRDCSALTFGAPALPLDSEPEHSVRDARVKAGKHPFRLFALGKRWDVLRGRRFGQQVAMERILGSSPGLISVVLLQELVVIEEVVQFAAVAAETGPNV